MRLAIFAAAALLAYGSVAAPVAAPDLSFMRYPQDTTGEIIVDKDDDGLPNVNLNIFDNNANTCPTDLEPFGDLKLPCNGGNFSSNSVGRRLLEHGKCMCGTYKNSSHATSDCYRCGVKKVATDLHFHGNRPAHLKCPKMSRRQILERALGWVVNGVAYMDSTGPETCAKNDPNPNCPQYTFQLVCNGFVDMAWYGSGPNCQDEIDCSQLQPGDHIYRHPHSMLWRKSFGPPGKRTGGLIYQMGGGWAKANVEYHPAHITGKCFRRKNLIPDPEFDAKLSDIDDAQLIRN